MRTTVEIPDRLRAALLAISAKRGLRGFSKIIEEALDQYVQTMASRDTDLASLLKLKGAWTDAEAEDTRKTIREVRKNWKRLA
jgi:metal-responsive CopG/Arc/MetJ family transcriptional regulator